MPSRNDITGDVLQTKATSNEYREGHDLAFGNRPIQRGSWKWDPELKKLIPKSEWHAKYGREVNKAPIVFCNHFEPFESPVTGRVINNKREHQYDLHSTGSRVYEGRESEQREADRWQANEEAQIEADIDHTLHQAMHDIEHGYKKLGEPNE